MRFGKIPFVLLFCASCSLYCSQPTVPSPQLIENQLATAFGVKAQDNWEFQAYPVDNFGIGTAYDFKPGQPTLTGDFICSTFKCLNEKPADVGSSDWLSIDGILIPGGGGSLTLTADSKKEFSAGVVLSSLLKLINLNFSADFTNNATVTITIPKAYVRLLDRSTFVNRIGTLPNDDPLRQSFRNGTVDYIIGDIVVTSMSAKITVNKNKNITASATLTQATSIVGKDSSLNMKMTDDGNGNYTLDVSKPVIVAYLHRRQPGAGQSGQSNDFSDWAKPELPIVRRQPK
jgi:hypothetical protein